MNGFMADTLAALLAVVPTTLGLFALSVVSGSLFGFLLTWMRLSGGLVARALARFYVFVFRGSPLLIQMFLIYYGLEQFAVIRHSFLWPVLRERYWCAVISLALCHAAYASEIFRGGVLAVPHGQVEAARACGMSGPLLLRRVIGPQALRALLPAYSTEIVLMMKSTSLASLVTVQDITGVAQHIIAHSYRTLEVFLCAGGLYLVLNFCILRLMALAERLIAPERRRAPRPEAVAMAH